MKAAEFDYRKARTLPEVYAWLDEYGDEARLLAGGQTLLATLNMRLSQPALLIDLGGLAALKGITLQGAVLRLGAGVTHSQIEASALVAQHAPLLAQAAPHIAHRAIRNLGTLGGSMAYADPAAEWPTCLLALDAVVVAGSARGERRIAARDFFVGLYTTALATGEVVLACELPVAAADEVFAFSELARRHGDYATVGLALAAQRAPGGLQRVRLALLGVADTPVRAAAAEAVLNAQALNPPTIDQAVAALQAALQGVHAPLPDLTHSGDTKTHLVGVLARRALSALLAPEPLSP